MASIDKIYGTNEQYDEFYNWAKETAPFILEYFYNRDGWESEIHPITNFPERIDFFLAKNCPIGFVLDRLKEQYGSELPKLLKSQILFIQKIKPYVYYDARQEGWEYCVKPNNNRIYFIERSFTGIDLHDFCMTTDDLEEG